MNILSVQSDDDLRNGHIDEGRCSDFTSHAGEKTAGLPFSSSPETTGLTHTKQKQQTGDSNRSHIKGDKLVTNNIPCFISDIMTRKE